MTESYIWQQGKVCSFNQAQLNPFNFTTMYGFGVFEGIRTYQTANGRYGFRVDSHIERLFKSADMLKISLMFNEKDVLNAITELLSHTAQPNLYIRPMITADSHGFLGIKAPSVSYQLTIAAIAWSFSASKQKQQQGLNMQLSNMRKPPPECANLKAKACGNYLNTIIALNEIQSTEIDDLLFCDHQGFIVEASGANVFCINDNCLYYPETDCALEGITQDTIIALAKQLKIPVKSKKLSLDTVVNADEVFISGTATEVMAVTTINGNPIGTGQQGKVTEQLYNQYHDLVTGNNNQFSEWLMKI